jgi:Tol biopolymer transport system component
MIFSDLSFSQDGKKLIYYAWLRTGSLRSVPISADGERVAADQPLISASGCRVTLPAFSPDGARIAFTGCIGRPGVKDQIFVMNSDGSNAQQLTDNANGAGRPSWYPDGRRILFESDVKGKVELFSVDFETRQQRQIFASDQDIGQFQLSPRGTQLAYNRSVDGVINIWLMDLQTQKARQITFDKELIGFPGWSPDGKFLTGEMHRGRDINIVILPSSGGAPTQLTFDHGNNWPHGWSSDGDKILFAKQQDDGIWNVWSVSRSTKQERQLTHYTKPNSYVRYPTMSPRGTQVVYEYAEATGNIWMLEFK